MQQLTPNVTRILDQAPCLRPTCSHRADQHREEKSFCSGKVRGENVLGPCGCTLTREEVQEKVLDLFATFLDGEPGESHVAACRLVNLFDVEVDSQRDVAMTRAELLGSEVGADLYDALVLNEGRRSDVKGLKMLALVMTFPTLVQAMAAGALGFPPPVKWNEQGWSARELERWAVQDASPYGRHAAAFVLGVWDANRRWACGPFLAHRAMIGWDDKHRAAFLAWARNPWWA